MKLVQKTSVVQELKITTTQQIYTRKKMLHVTKFNTRITAF